MRAVTDLKALGERQITLDCDVLQADGGTRCASITGAWVALYEACEKLVQAGKLPANPVRDHVAAISVGIYEGSPVLDLDYPEDSNCDTDMNVIMTGSGGLVEVQGTAEGEPFTRPQMNVLLDLAEAGIRRLIAAQRGSAALEGRCNQRLQRGVAAGGRGRHDRLVEDERAARHVESAELEPDASVVLEARDAEAEVHARELVPKPREC